MSLILLVCSKSRKQDVALESIDPKELLGQRRPAEGEQGCRRVGIWRLVVQTPPKVRIVGVTGGKWVRTVRHL